MLLQKVTNIRFNFLIQVLGFAFFVIPYMGVPVSLPVIYKVFNFGCLHKKKACLCGILTCYTGVASDRHGLPPSLLHHGRRERKNQTTFQSLVCQVWPQSHNLMWNSCMKTREKNIANIARISNAVQIAL